MYILNTLSYLQKLFNQYNLTNSFYENIKQLKTGIFNVPEEDVSSLKDFILSENPQNLKINILQILHPQTPATDFTEDDLNKASLDFLSANQLLNYVGNIFSSVTITEKSPFIILKYGVNVYNVGWTKWAKHCRGIVVDVEKMKIAGHPFDKFFNINEIEGWREDDVAKKLKQSSYCSLTDKKDGSLISVFKYDGEIMMTTNGSFDNAQINWAKELFKSKYENFYSNIEEGFTYIFELIHPENRVVLDYKDTKKLYLLNIRNMKNNRFLKYEQLKCFANMYSLDITESENFNSIKDLLKKAATMQNANKEGWVLRISNDDDDFFVKIKLSEYFQLHRMISSISFKRVYNLYINGLLETFLVTATPEIRDDVYSIIEEININKEKYFKGLCEAAERALSELNITREELNVNNNKQREAVQRHGVGDLLICMKDPEKAKNCIARKTFNNYQQMILNLEKGEA